MIIQRKYFLEHTYLRGFISEVKSLGISMFSKKPLRGLELEDKSYPRNNFYKTCVSCKIAEDAHPEGEEEFKCQFCEGFSQSGALSSHNLEFNIPETTIQ